MTKLPSPNVHSSESPAHQSDVAGQRIEISSRDARQGRRGNRTVYVLAASILLLLGVYAVFGIFSDALLVSDLPASVGDESALPGPDPAQEAIIEQR